MPAPVRQNPAPPPVRIGVISDTHGHIDRRVIEAFAGADLIVHAGDIDRPQIIDRLAAIAPVKAVRGNMDRGPWAEDIPVTALVVVEKVTLYVLHDLAQLDLDPAAAGIQVVISGHTHRAALTKKDRVVFLNPGSASHPRQDRLPTVAVLTARGDTIDVRFVELPAE